MTVLAGWVAERSRWVWTAAAVGVVVVLAGFAFAGDGRSRVGFEFSDGAAWLPHTQTGRVFLLDGTVSDEQAARGPSVPIAERGTDSYEVVQAGSDAVAFDSQLGAVRRVSLSTESAVPSDAWREVVGFGENSARPTPVLFSSEDSLWVLSGFDGIVQRIEVDSLRSFEVPLPVAAATVVDGVAFADELWLLHDDGAVESIGADDLERRSHEPVVDTSGHIDLVRVGERAVLVDGSGTEMVVVADAEAQNRCELNLDPIRVNEQGLVVSEGGALVAAVAVVDRRTSLVFIAGDLDAGDCGLFNGDVGDAGDEFGRPVVAGSRVFVPNLSTGLVFVFDVKDKRSDGSVQVADGGQPFELIVDGDAVFFNDRDSSFAGVITADLEVSLVPKTLVAGEGEAGGDVAGAVEDNEEPEVEPELDDEAPPAAISCGLSSSVVRVDDPVTVRWTAVEDGAAFDAIATTWDFDDGEIRPGEQQVAKVYDEPGTYLVSVEVQTPEQALEAECGTVEVRAAEQPLPPTAAFSVPAQRVLVGATVSFTDKSSDGTVAWEWVFEGGSPASSVDANPSASWSTPGLKTVTLVVTDGVGVRSSPFSVRVTVDPQPRAATGSVAAALIGMPLDAAVVELRDAQQFASVSIGSPPACFGTNPATRAAGRVGAVSVAFGDHELDVPIVLTPSLLAIEVPDFASLVEYQTWATSNGVTLVSDVDATLAPGAVNVPLTGSFICPASGTSVTVFNAPPVIPPASVVVSPVCPGAETFWTATATVSFAPAFQDGFFLDGAGDQVTLTAAERSFTTRIFKDGQEEPGGSGGATLDLGAVFAVDGTGAILTGTWTVEVTVGALDSSVVPVTDLCTFVIRVDQDGDGSTLHVDGDCDDTDPLNFPGNTEVVDGQDNDCDTLVDEPAVPQQLSPSSGTVFSHFPRTTTLEWEAVVGATQYTVETEFCQPPDTTVCTPRDGTTTAMTTFTFDFVGAQPGRWRVRAIGASGQVGDWSPWWEFRYTV